MCANLENVFFFSTDAGSGVQGITEETTFYLGPAILLGTVGESASAFRVEDPSSNPSSGEKFPL